MEQRLRAARALNRGLSRGRADTGAKVPYPGAIECLRSLRSRHGVKTVLISNSSRRAALTARSLAAMGFDEDLFDAVVTSGELVHQGLEQRTAPPWDSLGRRVFHVTWSARGTISLDGLGLTVVDSISDADFVLLHGVEGVAESKGGVREVPYVELEATLRDAAKSRPDVPLVCANPDFETVAGGRAVKAMPGALAKAYKDAGGTRVVLVGKPEPLIYSRCVETAAALGVVDAKEIAAVGDSLHHDIGGAAGAGIDSVLVACGIHADELRREGEPPESARVAELARAFGVANPTHALDAFVL